MALVYLHGMESHQEIFSSLKEKMQLLLKAQAHLLKEINRLKEEQTQNLQELDTLREEKEMLQQQVAILQTASVQMDEKGKKIFERRINHFIKDIDSVLAHLNQ